MVIAIWDFFFTRRIWTTVEVRDIERGRGGVIAGRAYVLRDQFGNIKQKTVRAVG